MIMNVKEGSKLDRKTVNSAGFDISSSEDVSLNPMERKIVKTGIFCEIPRGFVGYVCPRSGLAIKNGVTVLNAPGIIDSDYRGEVGVILINLGSEKYDIHKGDRIAQLIISPYGQVDIIEKKELSLTDRGNGGFGSTGV